MALKIACKHCSEIIEVPIPEPATVEKIVQKPCECGLTEGARTSRHWATAAIFVLVAVSLSIAGSCVANGNSDVDKIRAETEKIRAESDSARKEKDQIAAELKRYKDFFEEWKKLPGAPEIHERPPMDARALPHPDKK